jgi:pimeloyl-ACP methyl ester carboxylesterase
MSALPNIVLVHGAWADGSSWSAVTERLQADGYTVTAPQFPMSALADDVARLRQVLARQHGPTVVAGHSYGGQIITALGTDAPNVVGLVYIAGFGLDEGESIGALLGQAPPTLAHRPRRADRDLNDTPPAQLQPETSPSINPLPIVWPQEGPS